MGMNLIYEYPFWGPSNNGPARDTSLVSERIGNPQLQSIAEDSQRLKVPQETGEDNQYVDFWQRAPVIIPSPQGPVQMQEQFGSADSLLAYAMLTLGGQVGAGKAANAQLGNAGQEHVTNG